MATTEDVMKKALREYLPAMRENFKFGFKQSDNFIVWIIGSDVIGITLLLGNIDKLQSILGKSISIVLLILFLSLVCGIIYKLMSIPLFARWIRFESEFTTFTTPSKDFDTDEEEADETFLLKFNKFMQEKLGLTEKQFTKMATSNKTVFPRGFTANKFFKASIYLFLIAFVILIYKYIF